MRILKTNTSQRHKNWPNNVILGTFNSLTMSVNAARFESRIFLTAQLKRKYRIRWVQTSKSTWQWCLSKIVLATILTLALKGPHGLSQTRRFNRKNWILWWRKTCYNKKFKSEAMFKDLRCKAGRKTNNKPRLYPGSESTWRHHVRRFIDLALRANSMWFQKRQPILHKNKILQMTLPSKAS